MKVFISHSVKGDLESEAIARELFSALEVGNFEPFLDLERLRIGEDWEGTLRKEIDGSDAAVLLLSRKAVEKSVWVAREIHLLQVREGSRPGFLILPVLLGDVNASDLRDGRLAHLDLVDRQILRVADEPRWLDLVLKRLQCVRGGVLEEYLNALQRQSERLPYASLAATHSVRRLSEVYVRHFVEEQRAAGGIEDPEGTGQRQPRPARGTIDAELLLQEKESLIVEGGPGTGKSALLRHLADVIVRGWKSGHKQEYLPVLVTARTFAQRKGTFGSTLHLEVEESLGRLMLKPIPEGFFERPPTRQTRWLVLIDALDEVLNNLMLSALISDLLDIAGRAEAPYRFVVTTRPIGVMPRFAQGGFGVHRMLPFTSAQVADFAHKWFAGRDHEAEAFLAQIAGSRLRDLVVHPLLLTIAAIVYDQANIVHRSRVALYREFIATVLEREEQVRATRDQIRIEWENARGQEGIESADNIYNNRRDLLLRLARYVREGGDGPTRSRGAAVQP